MESEYIIHGTCEEGFESVKELFEHFYKKKLDDRSQLCIYVGEKCVVDLYGVRSDA
jgi:CubicO group peptidase (beta-lactamase class C family)